MTYYHCAACRDAALKKQREDAEKAKEAAKAKAAAKKAAKSGAKPPVGPDVITFDPRTHELVDGKVVPKKQHSLKSENHAFCVTPGTRKWMQARHLWMSGNERDAKRAEADAVKLETASSKAG